MAQTVPPDGQRQCEIELLDGVEVFPSVSEEDSYVTERSRKNTRW
jgi:hypothetical protein